MKCEQPGPGGEPSALTQLGESSTYLKTPPYSYSDPALLSPIFPRPVPLWQHTSLFHASHETISSAEDSSLQTPPVLGSVTPCTPSPIFMPPALPAEVCLAWHSPLSRR